MVAVAASGRWCANDEILVETHPLARFEFVVRLGVLTNHVVVGQVSGPLGDRA